jgi:NAD(P)-dependent dehydrogenase (short-subunit alcohol dehydrogenase family)
MNEQAPTALVTGGSRGLGRGVAIALAEDGFSVAICYRSDEAAARQTLEVCCRKAEERMAAGSPSGQRFTAHRADVAVAADRQRLLDEVHSEYGELDALVNNAGIAPRRRDDLIDATEESFDEVLRVNLAGPHFLTQAVARRWLAAETRPARVRSVVFVTSISAEYASTSRGEYCISKAGLSMSRELWAARLAEEDIAVYEVRPGIMRTDMTAAVTAKYDALIADGLVPQRRWGTAEDVGSAVASLLSGAFPFSQGTVIDVDGGFRLKRL